MSKRTDNRPTLRMGGPKGQVKPPPSPEQAMARGAAALLILANPVAAVLAVPFCVAVTRRAIASRVRGWVALWVMVAVSAVAAVWLGRAYLTPWRELARAAAHGASRDLEAALGSTVSQRWPAWIVAQLPLALLLALTVAAFVLWRRQRFNTGWQQHEAGERDPWATLRAPKREARKEVAPPPASTPLSKCRGMLGHSPDGDAVQVGADELKTHALVTGPTGQGKTTTLMRLARLMLVSWEHTHCPLVMLDFKGDPAVADYLRRFAAHTGRRFWFVSVTQPGDTYAALRHGTPQQIASRLMEVLDTGKGGGFTEPHYRVLGERWLIACMSLLDEAIEGGMTSRSGLPYERSLRDLADVMGVNRATELSTALPGPAAARVLALMDEMREDNVLSQAGGMRSRIALMAETTAGTVLTDAPSALDLHAAVDNGDVILFSLAAEDDAAAARVVGNMAVSDLKVLFARFEHTKWAEVTGRRVWVILDEFTGLGGEGLRSMFERARGGGGSLIVSTQLDSGLVSVSPEFADAIKGNANVWIMHRQEGDDAETRAGAIGTVKGWTETIQIAEDADLLGSTGEHTGVGSLRESDKFLVHPNELRGLQTGQCVMFVKQPRRIERVRVQQIPEGSTSTPAADAATAAAKEAEPSPVEAPTVTVPPSPTPEQHRQNPPTVELDKPDDDVARAVRSTPRDDTWAIVEDDDWGAWPPIDA